MVINETNHNEMLQLSYKVPVFLFCYSPYCGHCTHVHPTWNQLADKYSSDKKVIIAELNCVENNALCRSFHKINGYPTFKTVIKNVSTEVNVKRNIGNFTEKTESLKKLKMDSLFSVYNDNVTHPAFIISTKGTIIEALTVYQSVTANLPVNIANSVYMKIEQENESIEYALTPGTTIRDDNLFSTENAIKFINKFGMPNFVNSPIKRIVAQDRPCVLIITSNLNRTIAEYKDLPALTNKTKEFYWNAIAARNVMLAKLKLSMDDLPAAIITDRDKQMYQIFKNVSASTIEQKILSVSPKKGFKLDKVIVDTPVKYKHTHSIVWIGLVLIVSMWIGVFVVYFRRDNTPKAE